MVSSYVLCPHLWVLLVLICDLVDSVPNAHEVHAVLMLLNLKVPPIVDVTHGLKGGATPGQVNRLFMVLLFSGCLGGTCCW